MISKAIPLECMELLKRRGSDQGTSVSAHSIHLPGNERKGEEIILMMIGRHAGWSFAFSIKRDKKKCVRMRNWEQMRGRSEEKPCPMDAIPFDCEFVCVCVCDENSNCGLNIQPARLLSEREGRKDTYRRVCVCVDVCKCVAKSKNKYKSMMYMKNQCLAGSWIFYSVALQFRF